MSVRKKNLFKMGRRPNIWNIRTHASRGKSDFLWNYTKQTNKISKFDIEKLELLPFVESRKYIKRYDSHRFFTPIDCFLRDQVGRDYDEVYSELICQIPKKLRHLIRFEQYKMPSSFHPSVSRWYIGGDYWYRYNRGEPDGFFVDLETRVLGYIEQIGRKHIAEEERAKPVYQPFSMDSFKICHGYGQKFVFKQLKEYTDFEAEAANMKHCIRSYWSVCTRLMAKTSIWSLTNRGEKILTIQLVNNEIVQVRGLSNRRATEEEKKVVEYWAGWLKLTVVESAF